MVHEARDFAWSAASDVPHLAVENLKKNAGAIAHAMGETFARLRTDRFIADRRYCLAG